MAKKVDEANAFIWFGVTTLFDFTGSFGSSYASVIVEKILDGVPILVQLSGTLTPATKDSSESIQKIMGALDVSQLDLKVVSHTHRAEGQEHDYNLYVRKADGFLREPRLFSGVDSVDANSSRLVNYDGEMLPIIDVPAPSYLCVDSGDLFWHGELGIHRTIAACSYAFDSIQLVFSADLFSDRRTSAFGLLFPGIEANEKLAQNVIRLILEFAKSSHHYQLETYQLFDSLERDIGRLITDAVGEASILDSLPESVHASLTKFNAMPDLSQATFNDLIKILLHHWTTLSEFFPNMSKTKIKRMLNRLNVGNRRYLAHPYKAARNAITFSEADVNELQESLTLVKNARQNFLAEEKGSDTNGTK